MGRILMVYASREGQTLKIAQTIAGQFQQAGFDVDLLPIKSAPKGLENAGYRAVVIGASVHGGRFPRRVAEWCKHHRESLGHLPTWFFSVCLAAASEQASERKAGQALVDGFLKDVGLPCIPRSVFAGALRYRAYGWMTRWLMKRIAHKEGGETDTSRDHEYTDWNEVGLFSGRIVSALNAPG